MNNLLPVSIKLFDKIKSDLGNWLLPKKKLYPFNLHKKRMYVLYFRFIHLISPLA
jgi:hypothetical protein